MSANVLHLATSVATSHHVRAATPAIGLSKWFEILIPALATLVAAFAGVWYANKRRDIAEEKKKRANEATSGNLAIFTIQRQWNVLKNIQLYEIATVRPFYPFPKIEPALRSIQLEETGKVMLDPARFLTWIPHVSAGYEGLRFDFYSLSFFLETKHVNCLGDLAVAEDRFHTIMRSLEIRTKLHTEKAQPILEQKGIKAVTDVPIATLENALGVMLTAQLKELTDNIIGNVDDAVIYLENTSDELHSALKELYPGKKLINFGPKIGVPHGPDGGNKEAEGDKEFQAGPGLD